MLDDQRAKTSTIEIRPFRSPSVEISKSAADRSNLESHTNGSGKQTNMRVQAVLIPLLLALSAGISYPQRPVVPAEIKAFDIDFNWGPGGPNAFPNPGRWADADPKEHVAWYKALGCISLMTSAKSIHLLATLAVVLFIGGAVATIFKPTSNGVLAVGPVRSSAAGSETSHPSPGRMPKAKPWPVLSFSPSADRSLPPHRIQQTRQMQPRLRHLVRRPVDLMALEIRREPDVDDLELSIFPSFRLLKNDAFIRTPWPHGSNRLPMPLPIDDNSAVQNRGPEGVENSRFAAPASHNDRMAKNRFLLLAVLVAAGVIGVIFVYKEKLV